MCTLSIKSYLQESCTKISAFSAEQVWDRCWNSAQLSLKQTRRTRHIHLFCKCHIKTTEVSTKLKTVCLLFHAAASQEKTRRSKLILHLCSQINYLSYWVLFLICALKLGYLCDPISHFCTQITDDNVKQYCRLTAVLIQLQASFTACTSEHYR